MTVIARETAEKKSKERNAKKSIDWLTHNDKKLTALSKQLTDKNIIELLEKNPKQYIKKYDNWSMFLNKNVKNSCEWMFNAEKYNSYYKNYSENNYSNNNYCCFHLY